ncbi:MAG: asparagine synthase (glutamine-hydrolyzing) [Syntrophobacteraceae bacterium]
MCGIVGFINFRGHQADDAANRIKRMASAIVHRGPDEEGYFVDDYAAFGHRRLSIIDLSSGQQPMGALDGQVQIVFNGEIYNFQEVRSELEAKGRTFTTRSDTEVILRAYIEWGEQCVEKLFGMFAFAIWDARDRSVLLARDRVGKKPLYYFYENGRIAFASELKALRAGDLCPGEVSPEALDCYFTFGYIPAPRTVYRSVRKLPAAHVVHVSERGFNERRYWSLSFPEPVERSLDDAVDEFEALLDEAVKCRLMSEVPLGVFLSGGIDSPLVTASMASLMQDPVRSNSIGFDNEDYDELPLAEAVARRLKTDHRAFRVTPDVTETIDKIAWHFDEPFADSSAVPTWYVCKMARENVTVALSGDGGDEVFAGYTFRYAPHILESKMRRALPVALRGLLFGPMGAAYPGAAWIPKPLRLKTIFENLAVSDAEAFYQDLVWLRSDTRGALYTSDFLNSLKGFTPFETVRPLYAGSGARDPLSRSQYTDIHFYMTDDVLVKVDRMSMAHALEVRSPLLDHRIMEFASRLPVHLKLKGNRGKLLLRKAAERRLPPEVLNQPKRGFSIPVAQWLRNELKPFVEDAVFSKSSTLSNMLRTKQLQRIWDEHQRGARDHSVFLWSVMMFSLWESKHATNHIQ